jgi:hypothetical protein
LSNELPGVSSTMIGRGDVDAQANLVAAMNTGNTLLIIPVTVRP